LEGLGSSQQGNESGRKEKKKKYEKKIKREKFRAIKRLKTVGVGW